MRSTSKDLKLEDVALRGLLAFGELTKHPKLFE